MSDISNKLEAVLSAVLLQKQVDKKIDLRAKANQFLSLNKLSEERIETDEEFEEIYASLSRVKMELGKDDHSVSIKPMPKKVSFLGKYPHRKMAEVLGNRSIHLFQGEFYRKTGRKFVIEFNFDGKGRSRLPNGKVVDLPLTDISKRFASDYGIFVVERSLDTQWKVSGDHHKDVANKGFRKFLEEISNQ